MKDPWLSKREGSIPDTLKPRKARSEASTSLAWHLMMRRMFQWRKPRLNQGFDSARQSVTSRFTSLETVRIRAPRPLCARGDECFGLQTCGNSAVFCIRRARQIGSSLL